MIGRGELVRAQEALARLRGAISSVVVGQEEVIEVVLWALLGRGHVLLEGVPGLGKTLLVRALSRALGLSFSRIQCTPDLMPADILGTNVFSEDGFKFLPGPVFANIVLADEVNRATPKTQSALLEAMQERQVTVGNITHPLPDPFMVLATQNPIEMEGTYPLPEAQVDRFLFKAEVSYPDERALVEIIRRNTEGEGILLPDPVVTREEVLLCQRVVLEFPAHPELLGYAAQLVLATHPRERTAPEAVKKYVLYGASPRAGLALILGAKARAFLAGRFHLEVEDVQAAFRPAFIHRVILNFRAEAEGVSPWEVLQEVLRAVPRP
ncbi:MAG: MoxR family ATPase [Candidatus Bipolaricaulota bacterium]|nr:MoxR family ATPase [Candidatus Bipolaricaulota bacterium]MDW8127088.1 MoxR family ATPase [Candidatus Bipolaricaulota bacterium]